MKRIPNDILTRAIAGVGQMLEDKRLTQQAAEFVLDMMYKELEHRVNSAEKIRESRKYARP